MQSHASSVDVTRMTFAQKMRLIWIDAFLDRGTMMRRHDLCAAFDISTPQAATDIRHYRERHPDKIRYDTSAKGYLRSGDRSAFDKATHRAVITAQAAVQAIF